MIDVSKYEKIGEYRNGEMTWISQKKENIVYLIMFGNECYIGSSKNIRRRFSQYVPALTRGKYEAAKIQAAFDKNKSFDVYAIEYTDSDNLRKREEFYLEDIHPSLNTRTYADYFYREPNPSTILKKKNNVKLIRHKKDKSNLKGVFAKIPLSMYRRLSNLKMERGDSIERMVAQAIGFYVDIQDREYKTVRTAGMI